MAVKILAPAKINIGLRIIRKRSDNYHDLQTVFYPIHLSDVLEIVKADRHEFYSNIKLEDDANLCLRALDFFCERTGINAEVRMTLKKNIPIGAGLGGGSSDAAAVLLALQDIYGKPLSEIELLNIAEQLGSDVPFFLKKRPAYATGKGEMIEPLSFQLNTFILTVTPEIYVSTPFAYSLVTPSGEKDTSLRDALLRLGSDVANYKDAIVNDFEQPVFEKFPEIGRIKSEMYASGADFALMSGSGSSVYGFFRTRPEAENALAALGAKFALRAGDITAP